MQSIAHNGLQDLADRLPDKEDAAREGFKFTI